MTRTTLTILGAQREAGAACSSDALNIAPVSEQAGVVAPDGFAGNVLLVTLGCAKNLVDSEVMLGALRGRGFRPIDDPEHADLIVVNTCAFLKSAVEEGIDRILELARYKEQGRCRRLIVAGCMVERYRKDLEDSLPEVDRFISTDELLLVAEEGGTSENAFSSARRPYFLYDESMPRLRSTLGHTAYLKVAEGCDRPCTFCIIPKIRGGFRSRPADSVVAEAAELVGQGVKEINLVAQDLTSYGLDISASRPKRPALIALLARFGELHRSTEIDFWIRLLYAYPIGVDEELVHQIVDSPVICNYLDLPLQHISNAVLKRMNRPLGERGTRAMIEKVRTLAPQIALRTTFIVGFPGETDADADALEQFVSEGHFAHVGVFNYSQEAEAKSYTFEEQVPEKISQSRRKRIMQAQQDVLEKRASDLIGKRIRILVEKYHDESDLLLTARAEWQAPETDGEIILNEVDDSLAPADDSGFDAQPYLGRFAEAEITGVLGYDYTARLIGRSR